MADYNAKNVLRPSGSMENVSRKSLEQESKELESLSREGREAILNAEAGIESPEVNAEVSEKTSDKRDKKGDGATSGGQSTAAQIRQNLLNNLPPVKLMRKQVEKEIKKEIDYLHSRAMKMVRKPGEANYFELANLLRKIRELKSILVSLAKISLDHLKTLWLRFVHGIM